MGPVKIPMQLAALFVGKPLVTAFVTLTTAIALAALVLPGPVFQALPTLLQAEALPPVASIRERRQQHRNHGKQCEQLFHRVILQ